MQQLYSDKEFFFFKIYRFFSVGSSACRPAPNTKLKSDNAIDGTLKKFPTVILVRRYVTTDKALMET